MFKRSEVRFRGKLSNFQKSDIKGTVLQLKYGRWWPGLAEQGAVIVTKITTIITLTIISHHPHHHHHHNHHHYQHHHRWRPGRAEQGVGDQGGAEELPRSGRAAGWSWCCWRIRILFNFRELIFFKFCGRTCSQRTAWQPPQPSPSLLRLAPDQKEELQSWEA